MTRFFRLLRQLACDCRGAGVLEFALVAPVLLGMLIAVIGLGIAGGAIWAAISLAQTVLAA